MKPLLQGLLNRSRGVLTNESSAFNVQKELITSKEPVIFDIGAKVGWATKKYRNLFPMATIFSFEPFPSSYNELQQNTANDSQTTTYQLAISDRAGVTTLNTNAAPGTSSLLSTDDRAASYWGEGLLETKNTIDVNTTTIDDFCRNESIPRIDILKIDIQGAEYMALNGAREMLTNQWISIAYFEVIMAPTYEGQRKFHEYLTLMESFGYDFLDLYNPVRKNMQLIQADVIFVNKSIKNLIHEK